MHPQDTTEPEEWRAIPGFEGLYSVSSLGRVRRDASGPGTYAGRILSPISPANTGYLQTSLARGSRTKKTGVLVHTLVAAAFLGPRPTGYEINHKDGVKTNNQVDNLEYVTTKMNHDHASKLGLNPIGERHGHAKLTESEILAIRASEESPQLLANRYHVCATAIRNIQCGDGWRHVGGTLRSRQTPGKHVRKPSISIETIRAIRASTESTRNLAKCYGTSHETVRAIRLGERWSEIV